MRFDNVKHFKPEEFRRLTGVKFATFNKMVEIVVQALKEKKAKGGRPNKLSPEDMEYKVVVIDATESSIQRPKKSKSNFIQGRKSDTR